MNKKGFTLVELLGVIVILSIIMIIAIPNIQSVLERSKRDTYISDAKTFVSLVEYELRKGNVNKPTSNEIIRMNLSYLGTNDISKDPDGKDYDTQNSYVVVTREDGYLIYYVNLVVADNSEKSTFTGISLVNRDNLDKDTRYTYVKKGFKLITDIAVEVNKKDATLTTYK